MISQIHVKCNSNFPYLGSMKTIENKGVTSINSMTPEIWYNGSDEIHHPEEYSCHEYYSTNFRGCVRTAGTVLSFMKQYSIGKFLKRCNAYNKDSYAVFTFADGRFPFEFDVPTEAVKSAALAGGSGFMQFGLIRDREIMMSINRPRVRYYRTLAELNGNLCIIDSINMLQFDHFLEKPQRLGVANAL